LLGQILAAVPRNPEGRRLFADADFTEATFQGDARCGGATSQGDAWFIEATFQGDADFYRATFQGDAWFISLLTGIPRLADDKLAAAEERIVRAWKRLHAGQISDPPTLLSLRRANVAGLGLSNVNLRECRFAGAHNLDLLRLESDLPSASPGRGHAGNDGR
jgi:uncharacterized protein YjbI with pentapeptide repeats